MYKQGAKRAVIDHLKETFYASLFLCVFGGYFVVKRVTQHFSVILGQSHISLEFNSI